MNDKPQTERPRKRWKRVVKWTLGTLFLALVLWGFIAYWTSTNDCDRYATTPANPMKAVVYCDYGIANLKLQEIEKPAVCDNQILVRVRSAPSIHMTGTSSRARLTSCARWRRSSQTKGHTTGCRFAGTVEAVGKNVTQFKPGDEVRR